MHSSKSSLRAIKSISVLIFISIAIFSSNLFAASPKYIFFFIGDGMGAQQRLACQQYYAAVSGDENPLAMNTLPVHGITTTFSYDAMVTDSSAAATALATGEKTRNKTISMDINKKKPLETLAEKAKRSGMKVGIVTSVSIDHATPGAFYAHQPSRYNYYEVAMSMVDSGIEFFAGGYPLGALDKYAKGRKSPIEALEEGGYEVVSNRSEFGKLGRDAGKAFVYNGDTKGICSLEFVIDSKPDHFTLPEFTTKAIEMIDNPDGFFLMVEGGRIDWSCHSNDSAAVVQEIKAFDDAVRVGLEFYKKHADETLIVVTGDHETGGVVFCQSGKNPVENKRILAKQSRSVRAFITKFSEFKKDHPDFEKVAELLADEFGLSNLNDKERKILQKAYETSFSEKPHNNKILYGVYDPLAITAIHLLANRAGMEWTSYAHTGVPVSTTAIGVDSELFNGFYDNTDLSNKIAGLILQNGCCGSK